MKEKERFIKALRKEEIVGRVPHFELVFFLTMEVLGKVHPTHRNYHQWNQMSEREKRLHIEDIAYCYIEIAKKYNHSAIFVQTWPLDIENAVNITKAIKEMSNDEYYVMLHGDGTFEIPSGENMMEYAAKFYEEPDEMHKIAQKRVDSMCNSIEQIMDKGGAIDGVAMCSDYCFNDNPFFNPSMFGEFVTPYLSNQIDKYRKMGLYTIKHTDGNIMPILDQMVECRPDALHSLDPQGGVDLKEVKKLCGDKVCLIGNVNCGLLQTGTDQEVIDDVRRSLEQGMDGYGYIFSTSNCVYTGLQLSRYELMNKIWFDEGIYK